MQSDEFQRNDGSIRKRLETVRPEIVAVADFDTDRFDRQKRIGGWDQTKVSECKSLVAGAGALGNEIVKNLVLLGVDTIYLVDFDHVVSSNLSRCIFFRKSDSDRRSLKARVVSKRAERIAGKTKVVPLCEDLEKLDKKIYTEVNVAFSALDNLAARIQLSIDCYFHNVPLIDGGMEGFQGQVQVVLPPTTPCLCCSLTDNDWDLIWRRLSCTGAGVAERKMPALSTTTSLIAAIQVQEALKIIFGIESYRKNGSWNEFVGAPLLGKRLFYAGTSDTFRIYEISKNKSCPVCGLASGEDLSAFIPGRDSARGDKEIRS